MRYHELIEKSLFEGYKYLRCCVDFNKSNVHYLEDMIDHSTEISYGTFIKAVGVDVVAKTFPDYDWSLHPRNLTLKRDRYVRYYKSRYRGTLCYFIVHSRIEYIFVPDTFREPIRESIKPNITNVIEKAKHLGFNGFGGNCGAAAVSINKVLFNDKGKIVGAFNKPFLKHGNAIGHVAVEFNGIFWDADGRPKTEDEISSWAMLDINDGEYKEFAEEHGIEWNDETAEDVYICVFNSDAEVFEYLPETKLKNYIKILNQAKNIITEGMEKFTPDQIEASIDQVIERISLKSSLNIWVTSEGYMSCLPPNAIHDDAAKLEFGDNGLHKALQAGWIRVATRNKGSLFFVQMMSTASPKARKNLSEVIQQLAPSIINVSLTVDSVEKDFDASKFRMFLTELFRSRLAEAVDVNSEVFLKWFGNSKIVDEAGKSIIDGSHRTEAAMARGDQMIRAYVGVPIVKKTNESASSSYLQSISTVDQQERNKYAAFVKANGNDWSKGAQLYAKKFNRSPDDIFGEVARNKKFISKAKSFDFNNFSEQDWNNFWIVCQHCDFDRAFQKWALGIIKQYEGENDHYKYLYDRISCGCNGTQKYGTQDICNQT